MLNIHCWGYWGIILRCLEPNEITLDLSQDHDDTCGGHFSSIANAKHLLRVGYFSMPTLEKDCIQYVEHCIKCQ